MSMITAAQWVPRGFAAPYPQKYNLDESEYERIAELAKLQLDDAEEDLHEAEGGEAANGKDDEDDDAMVDAKDSKTSKVKFVFLEVRCQRIGTNCMQPQRRRLERI